MKPLTVNLWFDPYFSLPDSVTVSVGPARWFRIAAIIRFKPGERFSYSAVGLHPMARGEPLA